MFTLFVSSFAVKISKVTSLASPDLVNCFIAHFCDVEILDQPAF